MAKGIRTHAVGIPEGEMAGGQAASRLHPSGMHSVESGQAALKRGGHLHRHDGERCCRAAHRRHPAQLHGQHDQHNQQLQWA